MLTKKQLTETTWMLNEATKPYGYMRITEDGKYSILNTDGTTVYETYADVEKSLGKIKNASTKKKEEILIDGYPTKHEKAVKHPVETHPDLPTYINGTGKVTFVAGYVAIKYAETNYWQVGNCVKLSTYNNNKVHGPFKTKLEAMHRVKEENKND